MEGRGTSQEHTFPFRIRILKTPSVVSNEGEPSILPSEESISTILSLISLNEFYTVLNAFQDLTPFIFAWTTTKQANAILMLLKSAAAMRCISSFLEQEQYYEIMCPYLTDEYLAFSIQVKVNIPTIAVIGELWQIISPRRTQFRLPSNAIS